MQKRVDHLVLPVISLAIARQRWNALGFTVAPDGIHPFGTANCCVFFPEGPYLEPLAVVDHQLCEHAVKDGNTFVIRDRRFRGAQGMECLSGMVLETVDAEGDDQRFRQMGISAGHPLEFRRLATDSNGNAIEAGFRLAFADLGSDALFAFSCQRIAPLTVDGNLRTHQNTARRVSAVVLASKQPEQAASRLGLLLQEEPLRRGKCLVFMLDGIRIVIAESGSDVPEFGISAPLTTELSAGAIVIEVEDLGRVQGHLSSNNVAFEKFDGGRVVGRQQGQGIAIVFQQVADG